MKAIIISGMPAAGKTTVAAIIAKHLGLKTMGGGEILREMASEKGYHPEEKDWWDTEDGMKFLQERKTDPNFDKEADKRMMEKVRKGNIVLTSYTIPWLIQNEFKVWLDASEEKRAERMSKRDGFDIEEGRRVVRLRDKENTELYDHMYGIKFGKDKKPFDLIIDTDNIGEDEVASEVLKKIKELNL
jgi:CMP/dCMP kinase